MDIFDVMAARELGIEALDVLVLPDISDAQRIELELALNRLPEDSTWDAANLKIKIEQLIEYNVDLTFTGFETAEIDNILSFEVIEPEDQNWSAGCCQTNEPKHQYSYDSLTLRDHQRTPLDESGVTV